jgi:hypothetical protein
MHSNYFPVDFSQLGAKVQRCELSETTDIDGVKIKCKPLQHPGGSLGFSFDYQGHRVVYATDNELDLQLAEGPPTGLEAEPLRVLPAPIVEFVRGADLLIADGQYTEAEYPSKVGWGHPRATTLVDLAVQAGVKLLGVTHHDPMQSDSDVDAKLEECTLRAEELGSKLHIFGAREGVELKVG